MAFFSSAIFYSHNCALLSNKLLDTLNSDMPLSALINFPLSFAIVALESNFPWKETKASTVSIFVQSRLDQTERVFISRRWRSDEISLSCSQMIRRGGEQRDERRRAPRAQPNEASSRARTYQTRIHASRVECIWIRTSND